MIDELDVVCEVEPGDDVRASAHHALETETSQRLAEVFAGLADPTRVRLIGLLVEPCEAGQRELCVGELSTALGMSMSAISHQLALLRRLHLVRRRRQGRHMYYSVDDAHISAIFSAGLDHIGHRPPIQADRSAPQASRAIGR